tara:strand:+ start:962 stop:1153 length:192 start_codon:yes stop_codon:yes gene_type:complete
MGNENRDREDVKSIVEKALKEFSEVQVNLSSSSAREAIAIRIASDISERFLLMPDSWPNDAKR